MQWKLTEHCLKFWYTERDQRQPYSDDTIFRHTTHIYTTRILFARSWKYDDSDTSISTAESFPASKELKSSFSMEAKIKFYLNFFSQRMTIVGRSTVVGNPHTTVHLLSKKYYNTSYISRKSVISFFSLAFISLIFYKLRVLTIITWLQSTLSPHISASGSSSLCKTDCSISYNNTNFVHFYFNKFTQITDFPWKHNLDDPVCFFFGFLY